MINQVVCIVMVVCFKPVNIRFIAISQFYLNNKFSKIYSSRARWLCEPCVKFHSTHCNQNVNTASCSSWVESIS
jgi:hypothetical protein